jgi:hypothetical protein
MSLRAAYRTAEDRMELFLESDTETTACWVTRRQWLGLLHRVVHTVLTEERVKRHSAPRGRAARSVAATQATHAGLVKSLRVRQTPDHITLFITLGPLVHSVKLNATQLASLKALLQKQANLAGWDAPAALRRYQAASLTRDALDKASGPSKDFT